MDIVCSDSGSMDGSGTGHLTTETEPVILSGEEILSGSATDESPLIGGHALRKRSANKIIDLESEDVLDEVQPAAAKMSTSHRGGKASAGRVSELSRARAELRAAEEEAREEAANREWQKRLQETVPSELANSGADLAHIADSADDISVNDLKAKMTTVTEMTKNMRGKNSKDLKEEITALNNIVNVLASRSEAEEMRRLRADNNRLRREVENMKTEMKAYRRDYAEMRASLSADTKTNSQSKALLIDSDGIEEFRKSIISSVGNIINARFAGIEDRLLPPKPCRPPLAADKKLSLQTQSLKTNSNTTASSVVSRTEAPTRWQPTATASSLTAGTSETSRHQAQSNQKGPADKDGFIPVRNKKKKKPKKTPAASVVPETRKTADKNKAKPKPKLKAPTTSAVVISLQPEAAERGVSYFDVMSKAVAGVNLGDMGIPSLKFRQTASGARMVELPKELEAAKADELAEKLRPVLEGVAAVTRPTKCATVRIMDLDDSATTESVIAAVARIGGCAVNLVKAGGVQRGPGGMGAIVVRCPVAAAKILVEKGRVLVGWSSARVVALEQLPMRCYRCMGVGHTKPLCPSEVSREHLCYRCGEEGHRAAACSVRVPKCVVCTETNRPHAHVMGSPRCKPTPVTGKLASRTGTASSAGPPKERENAEINNMQE
ncbi:uncharacterized protein LOC134799682 [Cydia splendana]|uniref:uncharacterized protein LOC134799682 n=1 Tax=Cydia splendana TaxID=1100963 RepID=UPI00300D87CD